MSNSLIPHLLSESPPPIASNIDEDYDDEFGDFTGPGDLSFNNDSSSTPSTPISSKHSVVDPVLQLNASEDIYRISLESDLKKPSNVNIQQPTENYINILDHIENNIAKLKIDDLEKDDILEIKENGDVVIEENKSNLRVCDIKSDEISQIIEIQHDLHIINSDDMKEDIQICQQSSKEFLESVQSRLLQDENVFLNYESSEIKSENYSENSESKIIPLFNDDEDNDNQINGQECSEYVDEDSSKNSLGSTPNFENMIDSDLVEKSPNVPNNVLQGDLWHNTEKDGIPEKSGNCLKNEIQHCGKHDVGSLIKEDSGKNETYELEPESVTLDDDDFGDFTNFNSKLEGEAVISSISSNVDDDFSDFTNFQDFPNEPIEKSVQEVEVENLTKHEIDEDKGFDDEFDEFANYSDFNSQKTDGDTCSSSQSSDASIKICTNSKEAFEQANFIITKFFTMPDSDVVNYSNSDFIMNNSVFDNLKDITETNALMYQWGKSTAQKNILRTLNIDIRNILYGPSWNARVPLFAANLGSSPLEPVKFDMSSPLMPQKVVPIQEPKISVTTEVPAVEFDWNGAGLTNPLDSLENVNNKQMDSTEPTMSTSFDDPASFSPTVTTNMPSTFSVNHEKCNVYSISSNEYKSDIIEESETVPKNEDDFSDFTSYTPKYEIETNWSKNMLPLRESHISHDAQVDESKDSPFNLIPNVQSSIGKVNFDWSQLESKVDLSENCEKKLDYKLFETTGLEDLGAVDSKAKDILEKPKTGGLSELSDTKSDIVTSEVMFPKIDDDKIVQSPKSEEDEFTDFHSSLPQTTSFSSSFPEPLQPAVLQPIPVKTQTIAKIEWPEPGLDEEEIDRIVSGCLRKNSVPKKEEEKGEYVQTKVNQPGVRADDDEWTEFVSVKDTAKSRTSSADLPLSVFNLGSVKPNKPPIPLVTPNGLVSSPVKINLVSKSVPKQSALPKNPQIQKQPFITSQVFDALHQTPMMTNGFVTTNKITNVNQFVGFTAQAESSDFQNSFVKNNGDDDEWGDFVSAKNASPLHSNFNPVVSSTNIITNPSHSIDSFNKKTSVQQYSNSRGSVVRQERRNIPSISALPDLDFVSPKSRNWRK